MATTKLNYGYAAPGVGSHEKRRSQENVELMSQTAPSPLYRKTANAKISQSTNMTISTLMKSMADKTTLRQPSTSTSYSSKVKQLQLT